MDLWIEIWDRNRTEDDIDSNEDRAVATAKVRNGVIEKVVVINEGQGYVDPVVFVRGTAPRYNRPANPWRQWRCLNMRETLSGGLQICGHIETGWYPPENCPGEEDDQFLATDERDDQASSRLVDTTYAKIVGLVEPILRICILVVISRHENAMAGKPISF